MSCRSSAASSQLPQLERQQPHRHRKNNGGTCGDCNSQLCSSYLVGLLACLLVVGGIFLAFHRWDYMWLAVSAVGVLLILVGASLHYCGGEGNRDRQTHVAENGVQQQTRKRGSNHHRIICDQGSHNERLLPSAPPTGSTSSGHNFSVSQLSLNMLPPFFPSYDTVSLGPQGISSPNGGTPTTGPIMHLNGQSFLLLPIGGSTVENLPDTQSLARRLSTHLAVLEQQQSFAQKRCYESVNFGLATTTSSSNFFNFLATPSVDKETTPDEQILQVTMLSQSTLQPTKAKTEVQACQEDLQTETSLSPTNTDTESVTVAVDDEPIYQVPRLLSTLVVSDNSCTEETSVDPSSLVPLASTYNNLNVPTEDVEATEQNESQVLPQRSEPPMPQQQIPSLEVGISNISVTELITEVVTSENNQTHCPIAILETSEEHSNQTTLESPTEGSSRVSTPEPEWTLPPSYEEVAPPSFKRIGHLKFAYETL